MDIYKNYDNRDLEIAELRMLYATLGEYDLTSEQKSQFEQEIRNELSKLGVGVEEVVEEEKPAMEIPEEEARMADTFAEYRLAILERYGFDIAEFEEKLMGGRANGKPITSYNLDQILTGIQVETEHTDDLMTALEIALDHLEEIPDYYTRLKKMEEQAQLKPEERYISFEGKGEVTIEPDAEARLAEILVTLKCNPNGIVSAVEDAISPEMRRALAELIRSRLEKAGFVEAIDFEINITKYLDDCMHQGGIPMFRTRYGGERFNDPRHPGRFQTLFICYGKKWSQWFDNVSREDVKRFERK